MGQGRDIPTIANIEAPLTVCSSANGETRRTKRHGDDQMFLTKIFISSHPVSTFFLSHLTIYIHNFFGFLLFICFFYTDLFTKMKLFRKFICMHIYFLKVEQKPNKNIFFSFFEGKTFL
jgi:hypothetical protein